MWWGKKKAFEVKWTWVPILPTSSLSHFTSLSLGVLTCRMGISILCCSQDELKYEIPITSLALCLAGGGDSANTSPHTN